MTQSMQSTREARQHLSTVHGMLEDVIRHARSDIGRIDDPRIRTLLETTAEVLGGLARACEHAEEGSEPGWR